MICTFLFSATITLSVCNSASDCTECMAAHPACNWCITKATSVSMICISVHLKRKL